MSEVDAPLFACFFVPFLPLDFLHHDAVVVSSRQGLIEKSVGEVPTSASEVNCTGSEAYVGGESEVGEYEKQDDDGHQVSTFVSMGFWFGCWLRWRR